MEIGREVAISYTISKDVAPMSNMTRLTSPRRIRWMIGVIAGTVLLLVIVWALFVPVADWFAHHDVGSVTGSLHATALDNARGRLLTLGAGSVRRRGAWSSPRRTTPCRGAHSS